MAMMRPNQKRAQLYLDVQCMAGGGGTKPNGTTTPRVDLSTYVEHLTTTYSPKLVLDPGTQSRWAIQCALTDAFGWDGQKEPSSHHLQRLRDLTAALTYLPPLQVKRIVVIDDHDDCPHPHGED